MIKPLYTQLLLPCGTCMVLLSPTTSQKNLWSIQVTLSEGQPRDLLDALLMDKHVQKSNESEDERITDDHVLMTAAETFGAGVETTSTTLLWILAYLLHHPEVKGLLGQEWNIAVLLWCLQNTLYNVPAHAHPQVQKRIQKELDEQVGRERPVNVLDRSRLPYLDCVINEGMRIRPVSPVLIPHTARTNSRFGYQVPQKVVNGCVIGKVAVFPNENMRNNSFMP